MACPKNGPCSWIDNLDLCCLGPSGNIPDACTVDGTPVPQSIVDSAILAASELLWAATGRQFGKCSVVLRPCSGKELACPGGGELPVWDFGFNGFNWQYPWIPARTQDGGWTNIGCVSKCCDVCEIELPSPICSVDEVRVNGQVLGVSQYRVDDFRTLVRLPGVTVNQPFSAAIDNGFGSFTVGSVPIIAGSGSLYGPDSYGISGIQTGGGDIGGGSNVQVLDQEIEIYVPFGGLDITLQLGQGADFTVEALDGNPTITYDASTGKIISSGSNIYLRPARILIRSHHLAAIDNAVSFYIINDGGTNFVVTNLSWTDPSVDGVCWPSCQSLALADTEDNTFSVTVTYGREVPELVKLATATLACELIKDCVGKPCDLPKRVTSISRQGVTMALLDPQDFLDKGRTGIWIVDQAIATYNPNKLNRPAAVYSVDQSPRWRRAGT